MDSKFGALQFIVLPTGAITGPRIVLDGQHGLIQIYDAFNNLRLTIGDNAAAIKLSSGDGSETALAQLLSQPFGTGATRRLETILTSPGFGGNISEIDLLSASFNGTLGAIIQITSDDLQFNARKLPLGAVLGGYAEINTNQGGIQGVVDLTGTAQSSTITPTLIDGRRYRVIAEAFFSSDTANDIPQLFITDGANGIKREGRTGVLTAAGNIGKAQAIWEFTKTGGTGVVTLKLRAQRNAGASTVTLQANVGGRECFISVEDIGSAP